MKKRVQQVIKSLIKRENGFLNDFREVNRDEISLEMVDDREKYDKILVEELFLGLRNDYKYA